MRPYAEIVNSKNFETVKQRSLAIEESWINLSISSRKPQKIRTLEDMRSIFSDFLKEELKQTLEWLLESKVPVNETIILIHEMAKSRHVWTGRWDKIANEFLEEQFTGTKHEDLVRSLIFYSRLVR